MKSFALAILLACAVATLGQKVRFDNYRVFSVNIETEKQLAVLKEIESHPDGTIFLKSPLYLNKNAELLVPPHKVADITEIFHAYNMIFSVKHENFQKLIDEEQPAVSPRESFGWNKYYDLVDVYKFLDDLLAKYPNVLTSIEYGKSYENRTLRAVKVSHNPGKPTIFIESTIHAREWITVATTTYILNELLTSTDPAIREIADNYDWVIVPVTNVDGYAYTHSTNRMWRKTRQPQTAACVGADPNRNFDIHHGEQGASTSPCVETYAGPKPWSEPETLAISKLTASFDNLKLYIAFHSYSQLLMFPYGYTHDRAANHDDLSKIGVKGGDALEKPYGTKYTVGNIADAIYVASGSSIDWVYDKLKIPLSFVFEFRDTGKNGFLLPADQIIPNSIEVIEAIKAMIKEAQALNYL